MHNLTVGIQANTYQWHYIIYLFHLYSIFCRGRGVAIAGLCSTGSAIGPGSISIGVGAIIGSVSTGVVIVLGAVSI